MSEESKEPVEAEEPEEQDEVEGPEAYTSPLRVMAMEMHEVFQELLVVGFPDRFAVQIVAHMIQDAMMYRASEDDEDENDEEDDYNDDSGTL